MMRARSDYLPAPSRAAPTDRRRAAPSVTELHAQRAHVARSATWWNCVSENNKMLYETWHKMEPCEIDAFFAEVNNNCIKGKYCEHVAPYTT